MKKIFTIALALCCSALVVQSQVTIQPRELADEKTGIVYDREFAVGLQLQSNGWSIGANVGRLKTYYLTRYYHFDFGELKSPKEYRSSNDASLPSFTRTSRSFIYGKRNNLYVLRASLGEKRYFSEKAKKKGVAVGMSYEVGPSLGLLKPYYVEIVVPGDGGNFNPHTKSIKYSSETADVFLDHTLITGSAGFGKGWNEIVPAPGVHGKIAVHFDWGAFDEFVKAIETGILFDAYFRNIPLLVETDQLSNVENKPYFFNLFINLQLGKRW